MYELELLNKMVYTPFTFYRLFTAICISLGIWVDIKLLWMVIYEYKKRGDGEKYLKYGKKLVP